MNTFWTVILIILVVAVVVLGILYIIGSRMQSKQADSEAAINASKQTVNMLVIDKKKMRLKDAGLPKIIEEQSPWYTKLSKYPIVKAKVGPKVMTLMCDPTIYEQLPLKTECKVAVSGIFIVELKSIRGQAIPKIPEKKGLKKLLDRK